MATQFTKEIRFNRADKDFASLLNGEIVGFAPTYLQAEQVLNERVYTLLSRPPVDADDLTPEGAAEVLQAQQDVAADEQTAALQAKIQAEFEAEEARAGVLETQRAPVMHDIDAMFLCLDGDGSLEINARFAAQRPNVLTFSPKQVIALRAFFAMPRVAPTIEDAAAVRYAADEADREQDGADEARRMAAHRVKRAA